IEYFTAKHRDQLSLRLRILDMQPPQHALAGGGEVVLDKVVLDPCAGVALLLPGLHEESARVAKHPRFENQQSIDFAMDDIHGHKRLPARGCRMNPTVPEARVRPVAPSLGTSHGHSEDDI